MLRFTEKERSEWRYDRLKAEWLTNRHVAQFKPLAGPTRAEVCLEYLDHAEAYYCISTLLPKIEDLTSRMILDNLAKRRCKSAGRSPNHTLDQSRRWRLLGIAIFLRYFVIVRRATPRPCFLSSSTKSSSLSGLVLSSLPMISCNLIRIVS